MLKIENKPFLYALCVIALAATPTVGLDIVWDGGDGNWEDANWNGGEELIALVGVQDGADGWISQINDGEPENIIISGAATVNYDADALSGDFEMRQGSSLTISNGARWVQMTTEDWAENRWTELDMSALILDGGTFSRTGEGPGDGGGALIFGSWQGDDTFDSPNAELDHQEINIQIVNGGRLENEGEMWFGSWTNTPPNGTRIVMTINDGSIDLTGGDFPASDETPISADWVFTNPFVDEVDQPTYIVNFTGPGSITVDESGIVNTAVDDRGDFQNFDPITYQELWEAGILQADGVSGVDGASFDNFFTVTGMLGSDDYTLTRSVLLGDFDNDGVLTAADIDLLSAEVRTPTGSAAFDVNGDGTVDGSDRTFWAETLANTYVGDSNLDGVFDSGDFVFVFGVGEYEDEIVGNSTWADGDWDGSGDFDSGDFVAAFAAGGYEQPARAATAAAVPEPATAGLAILAGWALSIWSRRRNRAV